MALERDILKKPQNPFETENYKSEARADFATATQMRNLIDSSATAIETSGIANPMISQQIADTDKLLAQVKEPLSPYEGGIMDSPPSLPSDPFPTADDPLGETVKEKSHIEDFLVEHPP
jgi:hypothetical protein